MNTTTHGTGRMIARLFKQLRNRIARKIAARLWKAIGL